MTKYNIIRMAKQCGYWSGETVEMNDVGIMDFAALVVAAERDKYEAQFKKLMQLHEVRESQPNKPCCLAEREACAKLVDHILKDGGGTYGDAIRERGTT